ncbi:MAG: hypothetical protein QOG89_1186 [Thermomicrobiales bacterium]|nr:hypothetical protein [Thermomicrobiales bacterium]
MQLISRGRGMGLVLSQVFVPSPMGDAVGAAGEEPPKVKASMDLPGRTNGAKGGVAAARTAVPPATAIPPLTEAPRSVRHSSWPDCSA